MKDHLLFRLTLPVAVISLLLLGLGMVTAYYVQRVQRNVSDLLGPDSAIPPDLKQTLEELSNVCRAVADLAEFLQRNPNALLTGKRPKDHP